MNKKSENNQKIQQRIQVFARCRPLNSNEKKQGSPSVVEIIPDKKIVVKDKNVNREFLFDKVFSPDTKQIAVYKAVVQPLIKEVLMGYNCTVFAYGQTGTGKTFTMEGERSNSKCSWEEDPGAGIIPRSLHQLFEDLNKEDNVEFSVRVSFIELYNEELFDLLSPTELSRLRLFEDSSRKGSVIIQGLEDVVVNTKDEVYSILEKGTARRQTAATMLNASSSRSHTVFSVTIHIKENTIEGEELLKTGKLNLVDLAGSENVGRSGAVDKRAREAGNINQSLLTLGRVITALIEKQPHVPYRESKLTRLLQDSLGGHTKTSIIATISPALCNFDETISTLDYATKAKSITIKPEINQKMTKRALIREYTEEIERLRKDLVALRCKEGFYIDMDNYTNLMQEINEKKETIRDLLDKVDILKEENSKIEEMFNVTKKELTETCEKLGETSQKYESTVVKLSNTTDALNYTQKILTETALQRDEKEFLINIQSNTEKKLSQQAQKLLSVADETIDHVDRLHAKIARKDNIEKSNEEKCQEFRTMYQKQFALLDDLVSISEKQQAANLSSTKADIDKLILSVQTVQMQTTSFITKFVCLIDSHLGKLSANFESHVDSQTNWTDSLSEEINSKKETLSYKQQEFLTKKLPEFMNTMKEKNLELENWMMSMHKKLSEKIEEELDVLNKNSDKRKMLHNSIKKSLEQMCQSYEEIVKDFNLQSEIISKEEDNLEKDFSEKMQEIKRTMSSLEELVERKKEMRKKISYRDTTLVRSLENNNLEIMKIHQPLTALCNAEEVLKEDTNVLNEILCLVDLKEFSEKQNNIHQSQQHAISGCERFSKQYMEEEEEVFTGTGNALKNNLTTVSETLQLLEGNIAETNAAVKVYANSETSSFREQIEEVEKIIHNAGETVKESQDLLNSAAIKLKDEILKRDIEFEKFISEDLLKDIPTGTTPQRKNFTYPRILAATSPHDRILQRYRSQLAADTACAIDLPLNSSFNETDDSMPVSSHHNASFSSDDSTACETDSCASSVSDVSVDNGRNKENKKMSKKKSRLPKRLPGSKVFVKPHPPSSRRPLVTANPAIVEQQSDV